MTTRPGLRDVAVVALSWAVLWAVFGAALGLWAMMRKSDSVGFLLFLPGIHSILGAISGASFGAYVRRRRLSGGELPALGRAAALGAVSTGIVAILFIAIFGSMMLTDMVVFLRTVAAAAGLGSLSAVALAGVTRRALGQPVEPMTSLDGPIELVDGKLILRVPLEGGGRKLFAASRGNATIVGDELAITIPDWVAESLGLRDRDVVSVNDAGGRLNFSAHRAAGR